MEILGIAAVLIIGFGLGIIGTLAAERRSRQVARLADPTPFAAELFGPVVEIEVSHTFRSEPETDQFPNLPAACAFLTECFSVGGFSQIVLTAIDDPETPADVPDWWEKPATRSHSFSSGYSGMVCDAMVLRDGFGDSCGLPADHPVHYTVKGI